MPTTRTISVTGPCECCFEDTGTGTGTFACTTCLECSCCNGSNQYLYWTITFSHDISWSSGTCSGTFSAGRRLRFIMNDGSGCGGGLYAQDDGGDSNNADQGVFISPFIIGTGCDWVISFFPSDAINLSCASVTPLLINLGPLDCAAVTENVPSISFSGGPSFTYDPAMTATIERDCLCYPSASCCPTGIGQTLYASVLGCDGGTIPLVYSGASGPGIDVWESNSGSLCAADAPGPFLKIVLRCESGVWSLLIHDAIDVGILDVNFCTPFYHQWTVDPVLSGCTCGPIRIYITR